MHSGWKIKSASLDLYNWYLFVSVWNVVLEMMYIYRPQRSCGQGYVFTRVCDSVHRRGSLENPPGPGRPPRDQADPPGPRRTPLGPGRPPQTKESPPGPRRNPPGTRQTPPDQGESPQTRQTHPRPGTPPPPGTKENPPPPGRRLQYTVNERPVRILLECILVQQTFKNVDIASLQLTIHLLRIRSNGVVSFS